MQTLRNAHTITRFLLVWFALYLGAAVASPLVNPQTSAVICSGAGVMVVVTLADDGTPATSGATLECPLCTMGGTPVLSFDMTFEPVLPLGHVLQSVPAAIIAALTAAPPPGRGPPAFS